MQLSLCPQHSIYILCYVYNLPCAHYTHAGINVELIVGIIVGICFLTGLLSLAGLHVCAVIYIKRRSNVHNAKDKTEALSCKNTPYNNMYSGTQSSNEAPPPYDAAE